MKHNKLKLTSTRDKGISRAEWGELFLLIFFLVLTASVVLAFIVAGLKVVTEVTQ